MLTARAGQGADIRPADTAEDATKTALVPASRAGPLIDREGAMARLQRDREAHSHRQVWTKDAHGGPYRKADAGSGYDPLLQLEDGSKRPVSGEVNSRGDWDAAGQN
jgi:hypothetical protein